MCEGVLGGDLLRVGVTSGLEPDGVRDWDGARDALRVCVVTAEEVRVRDAAVVGVRVRDAAALPVRVPVGGGELLRGGEPPGVPVRDGEGGGD